MRAGRGWGGGFWGGGAGLGCEGEQRAGCGCACSPEPSGPAPLAQGRRGLGQENLSLPTGNTLPAGWSSVMELGALLGRLGTLGQGIHHVVTPAAQGPELRPESERQG